MLQQALEALFRHHLPGSEAVEIIAPDCWQLQAHFLLSHGGYRLRNLTDGDEDALCRFADQLGARSREMFAPYPWEDPVACRTAFTLAIAQARQHIDASYLLEHDGNPIGHAFLWKAGGHPLTQHLGLQVPELGIALADAYHGKGLGKLMIQVLQVVARALAADAIELTTAAENESGWRLYQHVGFEYVGMLRIPLGVDVTAAELGQVAATRYRYERHMVYLLNEAKRTSIQAYLAAKERAAEVP